MARFSITDVSTGAGSTTLPLMSLYAIASIRLQVREVHVFNTTTTAWSAQLVLLSTAGTQGAGMTENRFDPDSPAANGTGFQTHTVAPTIANRLLSAEIGAAVGAGVMWTFDAEPLTISPGTGNGLGVIARAGTSQVSTITFVWDE